MRKFMTLFVLVVSLSFLSACTQQQVGTVAGSAAGAGIGYAVSKNAWGSVIGAGAGALIGNELSKPR